MKERAEQDRAQRAVAEAEERLQREMEDSWQRTVMAMEEDETVLREMEMNEVHHRDD